MSKPRPVLILLLLAALFLLAALSPQAAWASGAPPAGHGAAKKDEESSKDTETSRQNPKVVNVPVLIAPVVRARRLVGYLYVTAQLTMADERQADHVRDVLPLVQDRVLRALNKTPLPAEEAETPEGRTRVVDTIKTALTDLPDVQGLQAVTLAEVQSVPF